jgi:hypothetical protein
MRIVCCFALLCLSTFESVGFSQEIGSPIRIPTDLEFSEPSVHQRNEVQDWLLEMDTFYDRHSYVAVASIGEIVRAKRGGDSVEVTSFRFFSATGRDRTKREVMIANDTSPLQQPNVVIAPDDSLLEIASFPKVDVDYCFDGKTGAERAHTPTGILEVKENSDTPSMYYFGWTNPLVSWLQSAPQLRTSQKTASDFLPIKDLISVCETNDVMFARWLMKMPTAEAFYQVTVAFREGRPKFVSDELCGKNKGVTYQMYPLGTVSIEWRSYQGGEYAPCRIIRKSNPAPKMKDAKFLEVESDTKFNWIFDDAVPITIFRHENIGKLDISKWLPTLD